MTVLDLVDKAEEEKVGAPAAVEKVEEKAEEEEEVPAPVEEDEAVRTRDPNTQTTQVGSRANPNPNPNSHPLAVRLCLIRDLHSSNFYSLPFYYCGHDISKTVFLSSLALLLPVLVNFDPP